MFLFSFPLNQGAVVSTALSGRTLLLLVKEDLQYFSQLDMKREVCVDPLVDRSYLLMKNLEIQDQKCQCLGQTFLNPCFFWKCLSEVNLSSTLQYLLSANSMLHRKQF